MPHRLSSSMRERAWAAAVALITMAVTLVPYLIGFSMSRGRRFMWLGYNLDDSCVYLSWMRQSMDGANRTLNLFTTDPQHGLAPNPLFWILGRISGAAHLPLLATYHGARLVAGLALLLLVWELIHALVLDDRARRLGFLFVCFSSGLGWLPIWWDTLPGPVDTWQPEAITLLSLYMSPLFCFSMLLQVAIVLFLLLGDRLDKLRFAVCAGLCGLLLAFTHTYDVITMSAVWLAFLVARALACRGAPGQAQPFRPWIRAAVAGLVTAPGVAYIANQLRTEAVFRERANVATLAPPPGWIILGYGLTLILAIVGAMILLRLHRLAGDAPGDEAPPSESWTTGCDATWLLAAWMVANIACAYFPAAFQRKLLQGAHFPIAILAGIGCAWIFSRLRAPKGGAAFWAYGSAVTLGLSITNIAFLKRETDNFARNVSQTKSHRTYLQPGELAALDWVRAHSAPGEALQPLPWMATAQDPATGRTSLFPTDTALLYFAPGVTGRAVYCGHWGETPDFDAKLADLGLFVTRSPRWSDARRLAFLATLHVRYIIFSQKHPTGASFQATDDPDALLPRFRGALPLLPGLQLRYSNADADVYEIVAR